MVCRCIARPADGPQRHDGSCVVRPLHGLLAVPITFLTCLITSQGRCVAGPGAKGLITGGGGGLCGTETAETAVRAFG